jgi:hypothetical protein
MPSKRAPPVASEDPNREIRTMILLTLPYPPLPVLAARTELDDGRLHEDEVTTSHTFIAQGLQEAMARNDRSYNRDRKRRQQKVFQDFLHAMATEGFACDDERLYQIYCRFSMGHLATYFPPFHPIDVRFQPLSYIVRNDKCHDKMAEYMAAQSLFYEDQPPVTREQYLALSFPEMLRASRDRIGHVMTAEERARLEQTNSDPRAQSLTRCDSEALERPVPVPGQPV